jgi:hypothetical protein
MSAYIGDLPDGYRREKPVRNHFCAVSSCKKIGTIAHYFKDASAASFYLCEPCFAEGRRIAAEVAEREASA